MEAQALKTFLGFHCVVQADPKVLILLLLPVKGWDSWSGHHTQLKLIVTFLLQMYALGSQCTQPT